MVKISGLAYPVKSEFKGRGIGAKRIGIFSTGEAQEIVTRWEPNKSLAFKVLHNPPAMEEMSPYRDVHAPHLNGYFDTDEIIFEISETEQGTSRLRVSSNHILRIDPVFYAMPIARWVIDQNLEKILSEVKIEAEK